MRYFLFSWRWALNCCSSCPCPRMAFGCSGQSHIQRHAVFGWSGQGCMRWVWRWQVQMDAAVKQMDMDPACPEAGSWLQAAMGDWLQSLRMNVKVFSPLFPKLALNYWKHFRCMKCQTEWKIAEMRSFGCGSTCMAPRCQMFAGPGDSLGHFDGNQLDRLRCSPRPSHCHRVAAANARRQMRSHQQYQARVSSCWRAHGTFRASEPSRGSLGHGHLVWFFFRGSARRPCGC